MTPSEPPFTAYSGPAPYVFVCYAHRDSDRVYADVAWLRDQGINIWYDDGISGGEIWRGEIAAAIDGAHSVLFFVSRQSLASQHCRREVHYALDRDKRIVTIYLEDVELPVDLQIGLNLVQALYRGANPRFRAQLLDALTPNGTAIPPAARAEKRPRRWLAGALGLLLLLLVGAGLAWRFAVDSTGESGQPASRTAELSQATLGVRLPENLTTPDWYEAWPRLIAQNLVASLSQGTPMKVIPLYGALHGDSRSGGAGPPVDYVVRGSLTDDTGLSLTLELIASPNGTLLWMDQIDLDSKARVFGGFPRADFVAHAIAFTLSALHRQDQGRFNNDEAVGLFLRAFVGGQLGVSSGDLMPLRTRISLTERAVELDPDNPVPWAYLATLYAGAIWLGDERARSKLANETAQQALALGPDAAWPYFAMAIIKWSLDRDFDAAERHLARARELDWPETLIELHLGEIALHRGNLDGAIDHYERSLALGGVIDAPWTLPSLLAAQLHSGRYADALETLALWERSVDETRSRGVAVWYRVAIQALGGDKPGAARRLQQAVREGGPPPMPVLARLLALLDRPEQARELLQRLEARYASGERFNCVLAFATAYLIGDVDQAFVWLDRAIEARQSDPILYGVELGPLRSDPRFQRALARVEGYTFSQD